MIRLYYVNSATLSQAVAEQWLLRLDPQKAERLSRMQIIDRNASLAGELLLRHGMWEVFRIAPRTLRCAPDSLGKPQVVSHDGVHFNISHSGSHCLCAISDHPVGIDCQMIRPVRHSRLAERFFTEEEQRDYRSLGGDEDAFFTVWARKEALGKLSGYGLRPSPAGGTGKVVYETTYQNCKICVAARA